MTANLKTRFLRLFRDFRESADLIEAKQAQIVALHRELATFGNQKSADRGRIRELEHDLDLMTTARVNGERELSTIRGQLDAINAMHEREIDNFKHFVDFFARGGTGTQVFGKMASPATPMDDDIPRPEVITGREASRKLQEQFFEEMYRMGGQPPRDPEQDSVYSSRNRDETPQ